MGVYINPPTDKYPIKEVWLLEQLAFDTVSEMSEEQFKSIGYKNIPEDKMIFVVIDNVAFVAYLVINSESEYDYVVKSFEKDDRHKFFILGNKDIVMQYAA